MSTQDGDELIGRILRQQTKDRKAIAFIDAQAHAARPRPVLFSGNEPI
jgi:hypothetical protein